MNGKHPNGILTYTAAAACDKGAIVKFTGETDANGRPTITPCTATTDAAIGVCETECAAGDQVAVGILGAYNGTTLAKAGGAVTVGANVSPTGTAVTSGLTIGVALDAAEASGDLIEIAHCVPFTLPA